MPKIDISKLPIKSGSSYPGALAKRMQGRHQQALGDPHGLTQFGVNLVTLDPGALSSLRHWHEKQDEFLVMVSGVCTLVDDTEETLLEPGDCAAFPAGDPNGHHLINRSNEIASFVVVGTRTDTETGYYSDVDMKVTVDEAGFHFTKRDGTPVDDV